MLKVIELLPNNLYHIMKNYFTRDMVRSSEVNYRIRGDE